MPSAKVSPSSTALKQESITSPNDSRPLRSEITNETNYSSDNFISNTTGSDNSLVVYSNSCSNDMKLKPYQKTLRFLDCDDRCQREITLGRRIGFYRFRGDIGNGNFSQVKVAIHCLTKEKVAVKILDKCKLDSKTQKMLLREISSMEDMHHPNIIRIFEVIETFSKIYLVMEYAPNGDLFNSITRDGKLDENHAKPLFAQTIAAIDHMHFHNIIHRDIKAENIFYADHKTIKVGDFGFSTRIASKDELLMTFCGSPPYAAPELFNDENYVGPYVDYWALGVLLYFMVTALMPFKAQNISSLKKLILGGIYEIPDYISKECSFVIDGLLQQMPNKRFDFNQLRDTQWLKGQNLPKSLPKYQLKVYKTQQSEEHNQNVCLTPDEEETYRQLKDLGISNDLICDNIEKGSRSNVTGTFRIILHRIINSSYKRKSDEKDNNTNDTQIDNNIKINTKDCINNNNNNETKLTKSSKSMTKSIKSLKNIFIDKSPNSGVSKIDKISNNSSKRMKKLRKSKLCSIL